MTALGAQALAALGAATGQHLLSVLGGHAQAEAVAAGADETGRLESPLHGRLRGSKIERRWIGEPDGRVNLRPSQPAPDPPAVDVEGLCELAAHLGLLERDVDPVRGRE